MTLVDIIRRVVKYGPRGVKLWASLKIGDIRLRRFMKRNARSRDFSPERGVTIIGSFTGRDSINKVMRDLLFMVRDTGIPFQALNTGANEDPACSGVLKLLTPPDLFRIKKHPLVIEMFNGALQKGIAKDLANIVFWEFEDGFLPVYPAFAHKAHVIGMSDFVVETLRRELPAGVKVSKLLYPFRPSFGDIPSKSEMRARVGIPQGAFVVFFNFDFASGFSRKNPDGAMRAFAAAFKDDLDAHLVFKTMRSKEAPQRVAFLERLAGELGIADRFTMVHEYLSNSDLFGLTNACDVYLSLHRGEGFGLGVAEAMSLGLPVVVSDSSSTTEFCSVGNSIPVPCQMTAPRPEQRDHLTYAYVTRWAEPSVSFAADALRRLKSDPDLRERIGSKARMYVADHFSLANFKASLEMLIGGKGGDLRFEESNSR